MQKVSNPLHSLPDDTHELKLHFDGELNEAQCLEIKLRVIAWLQNNRILSFVEGALDHLDIDPTEITADVLFEQNGGDFTPISVYRFDRESLEELALKIKIDFGNQLKIQLSSCPTQVWTEGWKESFKPITTRRFYVYPPWEKPPFSDSLIPIEIEPGMAFGTGQHATTQLCLRAIEALADQNLPQDAQIDITLPWRPIRTVIDVGTGTGILAIACAQIFSPCEQLTATDIDPDSISATEQNASRNQVSFSTHLGSFPSPLGSYDLVIANIIKPVLCEMMPTLSSITQSQGWLILSGLLSEDQDEMIEEAEAYNLTFCAAFAQDDWAALLFRRP